MPNGVMDRVYTTNRPIPNGLYKSVMCNIALDRVEVGSFSNVKARTMKKPANWGSRGPHFARKS